MSAEEWRAIPGYEGYEVSDRGRVRSFVRGGPRLMKLATNSGGYLRVQIGGTGARTRYVHQLVLEAFVSSRPSGHITRHLNGDPADNRLENLAWGTYSENNYDAVRHGTHSEVRVTHCPRGHEYDEANTAMNRNSRICRACDRERARKAYVPARLRRDVA